jgi:hypothetical protein
MFQKFITVNLAWTKVHPERPRMVIDGISWPRIRVMRAAIDRAAQAFLLPETIGSCHRRSAMSSSWLSSWHTSGT